MKVPTLAVVLDDKVGFCASAPRCWWCCLRETQVSSSEQVQELPSAALHRDPLKKKDLALFERFPICFARNIICKYSNTFGRSKINELILHLTISNHSKT
ncbi:hypothetical protein PanWU01x14_339310 [Parasponia andersonii]|uniref:Uncharacterized protein n=1 Tax=Parasponia andersonii TaxID=3476 RepID=A0A2P5AET6_PARAD|nr:hypothetical protein PanWU01x14_339310 [Parasponia andersonii]